MFCATVDELSKDLNQFDKTKHAYGRCGETNHAFDICPEFLY